MTILDWNFESDQDIRPGSIELQRVVHRTWHEKIKSRPKEGWMKSKPYWRVKCIDKLEIRLGRQIHGEVLEIGAGSALCSAFAAQREAVTRVTAMDYDRFCTEEMMPTVFEKFNAPTDKIRRALGSYNNIPDKNFYDFVIGVGALHHAEKLGRAFAEVFASLKPGGIFLVSDVCEYDQISNRQLDERYESVSPSDEKRYGRRVRAKDNGDHWYRFSEWLSAARSAGFEALPYLFDAQSGEPADDSIFAEPRLWRGFQIRVFQPYFSDRGHCDSMILILQKPFADGSTPAIPSDVSMPVTIAETEKDGNSHSDKSGKNGESELLERLRRAEEKVDQLRKRAARLKEALGRTSKKLEMVRHSPERSVRGIKSILKRRQR